MLISCNSCRSKYLVNSADLKPNGRNVQCAYCGNQWFQDGTNDEDDENLSSSEESNSDNINAEFNKVKNNLPSTYVKESRVSIFNSFVVLMLAFILIACFWSFKYIEANTIVLLKYYISEFYFNLNLIINDLAKIIHNLIN